MQPSKEHILRWAPRVLAVAFAAFLSLFALDVFNEGLGAGQTLLALLVHLVPVYLVAGTLILAWRWPWVGAVLFAVLGAGYLIMAWGRFPWSVYVLMAGPLFLIAVLFWMSWQYRATP